MDLKLCEIQRRSNEQAETNIRGAASCDTNCNQKPAAMRVSFKPHVKTDIREPVEDNGNFDGLSDIPSFSSVFFSSVLLLCSVVLLFTTKASVSTLCRDRR